MSLAVWLGQERLMRNLLVLGAILLTVACGGNSPTAPSTPPPPPVPVTVTLSGRLTATVGGQALPGIQAALGQMSVQTDGQGAFTASLAPQSALTMVLTGEGIVPRTLNVAALSSRSLLVDAIALGAGFDLAFYRQFVRDATENPNLQSLRRWTQAPSLYLQTGVADARTLDQVESVARDVIPQWTNHQYGVAAVERGTGTRAGQSGWITVLFSPETTKCGSSDIAVSGGTITFYPNNRPCGCTGFAVRPRTIRHEFGHAMGFYHVDDAAAVMTRTGLTCDQPLSTREAYHAAVAYSRPVGNQDPDNDPSSAVALAPMRVVE